MKVIIRLGYFQKMNVLPSHAELYLQLPWEVLLRRNNCPHFAALQPGQVLSENYLKNNRLQPRISVLFSSKLTSDPNMNSVLEVFFFPMQGLLHTSFLDWPVGSCASRNCVPRGSVLGWYSLFIYSSLFILTVGLSAPSSSLPVISCGVRSTHCRNEMPSKRT